MTNFVIRRIAQLVVVLFILSVLVFVGMRVLASHSIPLAASELNMTQAQLRHEVGLDRNVAVQYVSWMGRLFKGDMGTSILYKTPVTTQIVHRLPVTLEIGLLAWIVGTLIGIFAGILCSAKRDTWVDTLVRNLANVGASVPIFCLALILVYALALELNWLPVQGITSPFEDFWLNIRQIIMPVMSLALFPVAVVCRQTHLALLGVVQDRASTAGSKGMRHRGVILRQALKNSLAPVAAVSGVTFSAVIGGTVLVDTIFNLPGLGPLALTAVFNHDYPYVQGIVLVVAALVLVVGFLVDLFHFWLDRQSPAPGSDLKTDTATGDTVESAEPALRAGARSRFQRVFGTRPVVKVGLVILALLLLTAIFAPLIAPYGPNVRDEASVLLSPSWSHPLGTDTLGRDAFSRFVYASRPALIVVVSVGAIAAIVGGLLGLLAGFLGGWVNYLIMRVMDALMAIPLFLLAMVVVATLGDGMRNVIFALSVGMVAAFVRVMRNIVLRVKGDDQALRSCVQPFLSLLSVQLGGVVLVEAGLSFLGIGVRPPTADWGGMVGWSRQYLLSNPWLLVPAGLALVLVVFAINTVGDGLTDKLDPRLRGII